MSEDEVKALNKKMDRVLSILESDPTTNTEGLVEKVNRLDKQLIDLNHKFRNMVTKILGIGAGVAAAVTVVFKVVTFIFK